MYVLYANSYNINDSKISGNIFYQTNSESVNFEYRRIMLENIKTILNNANHNKIFMSINENTENGNIKLPLFLVQYNILLLTYDVVLNDINFDGYIISIGNITLNNSTVNGLIYSVDGNINISNCIVTPKEILFNNEIEKDIKIDDTEENINKNTERDNIKNKKHKKERQNLIQFDLSDNKIILQDRSIIFLTIGNDYTHTINHKDYLIKFNILHKVSKIHNIDIEFYKLESVRNKPSENVLKCKFTYNNFIKFKKDMFKTFTIYNTGNNSIELTSSDIKPTGGWKYVSYVNNSNVLNFFDKKFNLNNSTAYRLLQWKTGAINLLIGRDNLIKMVTIQSHHKDHKYIDKWQWISETHKFLKGTTPISANVNSIIDINVAISDHTSILMRIHGIGKITFMSNSRSALSGIMCTPDQLYVISPENMNNFMKIE